MLHHARLEALEKLQDISVTLQPEPCRLGVPTAVRGCKGRRLLDLNKVRGSQVLSSKHVGVSGPMFGPFLEITVDLKTLKWVRTTQVFRGIGPSFGASSWLARSAGAALSLIPFQFLETVMAIVPFK